MFHFGGLFPTLEKNNLFQFFLYKKQYNTINIDPSFYKSITETILINFPKKYNYSLTFYPLINSGRMGLSKSKKSKIKS